MSEDLIPSKQSSPGSDSSVEVARITARQAISVAVITSLAGLLGGAVGYFANHPANPPANPPQHAVPYIQHRISIDGLTLLSWNKARHQNLAIRIVADVNGQAYSYPSRVIWADIGSGMSKEEFPLAPAETYRVHFSAYLRSPDGGVMFLQSQEFEETSPGVEYAYLLYAVDVKTDIHGPEAAVQISYHVQ
jgi:hypothetical protein